MLGYILIVDEDIFSIANITKWLNNSGYKYISVPSRAEALKILDKENIALVMMDMIVDDHHGYETINKIKQKEITHHIPVITMSADPMYAKTAREYGASEVLIKPFYSLELAQKFHNIFKLAIS